MRFFIYALIDPLEPDHIRYIGMSNRSVRPMQHQQVVKTRRGSLRRSQQWIRDLNNAGRNYQVLILEYLPEGTTRSQTVAAEHEAMRRAIAQGHQITNYNKEWFEGQVLVMKSLRQYNESTFAALIGRDITTVSLTTPILVPQPKPLCGAITHWGLPCTLKVSAPGDKCRYHKNPAKIRTNLRVGMRIVHPKFGDGTITFVNPYQDDKPIIVMFDTCGRKKLRIRQRTAADGCS